MRNDCIGISVIRRFLYEGHFYSRKSRAIFKKYYY